MTLVTRALFVLCLIVTLVTRALFVSCLIVTLVTRALFVSCLIPGEDTFYKWANGDVPLDGVAFSRQD